MRTVLPLCFALVALATTHAQDSKGLDEIIRKRDSLLAQIVEATKAGRGSGIVTEEQVRNATMNLYSFRRDSAKSQPERLRWQEQIVALEKEEKAIVKKRLEIGLASSLDELLAEERVLAAEQKLLEIQSVK